MCGRSVQWWAAFVSVTASDPVGALRYPRSRTWCATRVHRAVGLLGGHSAPVAVMRRQRSCQSWRFQAATAVPAVRASRTAAVQA